MDHTMVTFRNDNLCHFMSKDEIRAKAPFIFAEKPSNPNVSQKYVFASTETIIDDMAKLGWGVVDCKQQRANKRSNIRSFHMTVFQNPKIYVTNENEDGTETIECYPRIIVQNSGDGFHSFRFMCGFFRVCCSNGLIISTQTFEDISIRHVNYTLEELRKTVAKAIQAISDNVETMNEMQKIVLNDEQKMELATKALAIRNGKEDDDSFKVSDEEIADVLTPVRKEDEGNSLWNVFNVLQEKMIKGTYQMKSPKNGKMRKAREIKGIAKDTEINQKLYFAAYQYKNAV